MEALKPIAEDYLRDVIKLSPGDRLHRLVARLGDTYIDDLTEENIIELERLADTFRLTHADGSRLTVAPARLTSGEQKNGQ
jgi:hypothetical protein